MSSYLLDPETWDIPLDADGQPAVGGSIVPELLLAIGIRRGLFHADPSAGSDVWRVTAGDPPPLDLDAFLDGAVRTALARLESQGLATVQAVAVDGADIVVDVLELPEPLAISELI